MQKKLSVQMRLLFKDFWNVLYHRMKLRNHTLGLPGALHISFEAQHYPIYYQLVPFVIHIHSQKWREISIQKQVVFLSFCTGWCAILCWKIFFLHLNIFWVMYLFLTHSILLKSDRAISKCLGNRERLQIQSILWVALRWTWSWKQKTGSTQH